MTDIELLEVHDDPRQNPYHESDAIRALQVRSRITPLITRCDRIAEDAARYGYIDTDGNLQTGGISYGGEMVDGKPVGALHVFNQATLYKAINAERAADFIDEHENRWTLIQTLLDKIRPDWLPGWARANCPDLLKWLDEQDDGYAMRQGEFSIEVRSSPPDPAKHVIQAQEAQQ